MLRQLYARLRALWDWRRKESELDEEIQFHLSEEAAERAAAGLSADQARTAARKDFGSTALIRERTREAWGWASAERLVQDARGALRMASRDPGFAAVAVLTLALGIAAAAGILNVVHALILRPIPFPDSDRLVVLFATTPARGVARDTTSFHDISAWRSDSHAFTEAAAYRRDDLNITGDDAPEPVMGLRASHTLLATLGVSPAVGRSFDAREEREAQPVALISHGLWTRRYGSDPRILSRTILLNEVRHSVIGVLPPGFQFPAFQPTDVLLPVPIRACRSCGYLRAVARLKPDVPAAVAQQELDTIAARLAQAFPDSNEGRGVNVVPLQEVAVGAVRTPLLVLLGAGLFVLLIGCGNVGNLVLARGIARQRELAVRSALGAGAGRLVRQLLTESVSLALIAALLGAVLAYLGSELLMASLAVHFPLPEVPFNWTLPAFALLVSVLSGLLTGLPPALMVWRSDLTGPLKQDGRSQSGGVTPRRLRNVLVVAQTALTVMLLVGAGLLVKSFVLLQRVEIGWDPSRVLTADLLLSARRTDPEREIFLRDVTAAIAALPGVRHVGVHTDSPSDGGGRRETFTLEGRPDPSPKQGHPARCNIVDGDFFAALGVPVVRGRDFDRRDTAQAEPVAIVNESMARQLWPGEEALGKRLRLYYDKDPQRWVTVVGIVRDARYRYEDATRETFQPSQIFLPHRQHPYRSLPNAPAWAVSVIVRTANEPASMANALQAAIWSVDKDQPILNLQTMEGILWESVAAPRIYMMLLGIFAAIALVIASAGIYGVSAYAVVRRTREIGIRLAVGATRGQILRLIVRQGMVLTLIGVSLGVAGSLALSKVISGFLYGITAEDTSTFVAVLVVFVAVAFLSTGIPARRAASIDPTVAFRYD